MDEFIDDFYIFIEKQICKEKADLFSLLTCIYHAKPLTIEKIDISKNEIEELFISFIKDNYTGLYEHLYPVISSITVYPYIEQLHFYYLHKTDENFNYFIRHVVEDEYFTKHFTISVTINRDNNEVFTIVKK